MKFTILQWGCRERQTDWTNAGPDLGLALDPRDSSTLYAGGQGGLFTIRLGEEAR